MGKLFIIVLILDARKTCHASVNSGNILSAIRVHGLVLSISVSKCSEVKTTGRNTRVDNTNSRNAGVAEKQTLINPAKGYQHQEATHVCGYFTQRTCTQSTSDKPINSITATSSTKCAINSGLDKRLKCNSGAVSVGGLFP